MINTTQDVGGYPTEKQLSIKTQKFIYHNNLTMQDTNQPPHPANNDYAVKVIQEEIVNIESTKNMMGYLTYADMCSTLIELLEKLKS